MIRKILYFQLLAVVSPFLLLVTGCYATSPAQTDILTKTTIANRNKIIYPNIDKDLGEALQPNEKMMAEQISAIIEQSIRQQYSLGHALRDAHPKAHGCVRATFQVKSDLNERFAKGMFIPNKTYSAWIRFSNASGDAKKPDYEKDARGIAIKVLGVTGKKVLESEPDANTQDFIMINHPVFFVNDPKRYQSFIQDVNSESLLKKLHIPIALGAKGTINALKAASSKIANPLQARYWSMVPYQLGLGAEREAVKYSVRACSQGTDKIPNKPHQNFLREALRNELNNHDACMEFLIQPRTSPKMLTEDSMTEWKENKAPFYNVATIRIPQQVFDTPEQNKFCENLSFTPWHALPDHKPLGAINRLRKVIYENISTVRHEMNAAPRQEPQ